jgi:hypothetical protein
MTTPDAPAAYKGNLYTAPPTPQESSSVYTDKTTNTAGPNAQPVREFLIKFEYLQKGQQIPIINNHCQLLASLLSTLKDQITIYDKNDKAVDIPRLQTITSVALFREFVDIHTRTANQVRHVIIMKVRTSLSLYEIRTTSGIMRQLKDMQAFIQEHHFTIDEWDIASVGWFHDLHPNHMCYDMIVNHSNKLMATAIKTSFPPKTQIPFYKLSNCTPKYQADGQDDMRTKAIQITCARSASKQLHKLLVKAYADNTIYVPWTARRTNPTWYRNCMRAQHKYLCNTWTLPVTGVPRFEMWYFENEFASTGLIMSVHPHRATDTTGRWNLLVHKENIKAARQSVQAILDKWDVILPNEAAVRSAWNLPRRAGSDRPFGEEVSSEGDRTYASASMASLSSILTAEDQDIRVTASSTNYFDYTTETISIPTPATSSAATMSYLQAATGTVTQQPGNVATPVTIPQGPTANEIRLQAEIDELKKIIAEKLSPTVVPAIHVTEQDTATTTSTMTSAELVIRQTQFEQTIHESIQQAITLQMTSMFEKLSNKMVDSTTSIENEKKHQAPDANSPVKQSEPKRQDIKSTPPTKNHPVTDVPANQNP